MHNKGHKARQASRAEIAPSASSLNSSTPHSSADGQTGKGPKRTAEVDFCELADGTLVEMIEKPRDPAQSFLATKNGRVRYMEKLDCGDRVLIPISKDGDIIRHVRLANGADAYESARDLLAGIMLVLSNTLELSWGQLLLLGCFVLSTWFVEKLSTAPCVALVGPPGSGKTTALRILNLLCRRALLTADVSSAAFYEVCNRMTPTLLIDEAATLDNRRQLLHLLRSGTSQDFVAVRKGSTYKSYGARVVSWLELPDDAALNSRCVIIPMTSCRRTDLLTPADPGVLRAAQMLQRQLLRFRLLNYKKLTLPKITGEEELMPRTRDLFRALALPLGKEKEICEGLCALLKQQESVREVLSVFQSAVLDNLYDTIHAYPELNALKVGDLTESVNADLRQRGEPGTLTEKRVGSLLTSLQLTNRVRTNVGYVLWLNHQTRAKIHSLARAYGVKGGPTADMTARCQLCQITSERSTAGSTTKPIDGNGRSEANSSREHGEHRERGTDRARRKPARAVPAASSRRR
jgi:energy-coupling factor transporter ATP-binding protein EcfA2